MYFAFICLYWKFTSYSGLGILATSSCQKDARSQSELATGHLFAVACSRAYVMLHFLVLGNQTPTGSYGNEVTDVF